MMENPDNRFIQFLMQHEVDFNDGIHYLNNREKKVAYLPNTALNEGSGWMLLFSDVDAGEWNIARPFGRIEEAIDTLKSFPKGSEFQLFLSSDMHDIFHSITGYKFEERLLKHIDTISTTDILNREEGNHFLMQEINNHDHLPDGFEIKVVDRNPSGAEGFFLGLYVIYESSVAALVKTILTTPNTAEVYIETSPAFRKKGLAKFLLKMMRSKLREARKRMIYLASESNTASLETAASIGLTVSEIIYRFKFHG